MRRSGLFALVLTLGAVFILAALIATISRRGQEALPISELTRAGPVPSQLASPLDSHIQFMTENLTGQRRFTEADIAERFTPSWAARLTVDELQGFTDLIIAEDGPVTFVRVKEQYPRAASVLVVDKEGLPGELVFTTAVDDKLDGLVPANEPSSPRLPNWRSTLALLGAAALIASAAAARFYRASREAWILMAAAALALAPIMILSDSRTVYTAGRVVPSLVVVLVVALLAGPGRDRRWPLLVAAAVAAGLGAVAPLARDSALIGHPPVLGRFADSDALFRMLLGSSSGLTALVMIGVAAVSLGQVPDNIGQMRLALWLAGLIAGVLALANLAAAVDYGLGDGSVAAGPADAVASAALAVVGAVVVFRLIASSWDRPELASLVIDLEREGRDLQPAIARALEDPSLQVLRSSDSERLLDDSGRAVDPQEIPEGRTLTRIQSGDRLVGALVHAPAVQRNSARLEAVAAATGMALEVSRLNKQVVAQLAEVDASRARILEASDNARRQVERDLHDGAQQRLVSAGLRLERARRRAGTDDPGELGDLLEDVSTEVRGAIEEIRAVSRGRQPALLAERGLATAVDALAERSPVPVRVEITARELPARTERTAYYVIAEGLTNTAKHAEATGAEVSITRPNGVARITIRDDGKGGARIAPGSGLEGLDDRIATAGGTFRIESGPAGTTLEATIPCE